MKIYELTELLRIYPGCGVIVTKEDERTLIEVVNVNKVYVRNVLSKKMIDDCEYDLVKYTIERMLEQVSSYAAKYDTIK